MVTEGFNALPSTHLIQREVSEATDHHSPGMWGLGLPRLRPFHGAALSRLPPPDSPTHAALQGSAATHAIRAGSAPAMPGWRRTAPWPPWWTASPATWPVSGQYPDNGVETCDVTHPSPHMGHGCVNRFLCTIGEGNGSPSCSLY